MSKIGCPTVNLVFLCDNAQPRITENKKENNKEITNRKHILTHFDGIGQPEHY
jgi:hypothetical protein